MHESRLPYPGLRAFDRDEADLFFGRDGAVDNMIDRLAESRFLAVLGASGSGKSSLVKTGLLDGLELGLHPAGSNWKICTFTPGGMPFHNLATALYDIQMDAVGATADSSDRESGIAMLEGFLRQGPRSLIQWTHDGYLPEGANLLLLVDQFEELFRYGGYSEREEAEAFVKLLIASTSADNAAIHCVITMRSDFLGACALIPGLAETINTGAYLTPRMMRNDCREAIVGPARSIGVDIEPGLANRLLNDLVQFAPWEGDDSTDQVKQLARRADQLPVMQHLLNRLWQHARTRTDDDAITLTEQDYDALGGLNGALDAHGAELLAKLDADEQLLACDFFRALVGGDSPVTATRRPLRFRDLVACTGASEEQARRVLDVFRADDCNFLRPGTAVGLEADTIVDISHESLIRQWSELSDWVTEEARAAGLWRRLSTAAKRFHIQEGGLLTGLDLANLSAWWDDEQPRRRWTSRYSDNFDDVEKFLTKSVDAQQERERDKVERDLRDRNRLRIGLASMSGLAIAASVLAFWAIGAEDRANDANVAAVSIVQNVTGDLFSAIDDGLATPIEQRHAMISQSDDEIIDVAERLENNDQAILMHMLWLTLTGNSLLDAGWVREAWDRATRLEELLQRNESVVSASSNKDIHVDALVILGRAYAARGEFGRSREFLELAGSRLNESRGDNFPDLRRAASIAFFKSEVAKSELRYSDFLKQVADLRGIYTQAIELSKERHGQSSAQTQALLPGANSLADTSFSAAANLLSNEEKTDAQYIIGQYIRAQSWAIAKAHNDLQSEARGLVQLRDLVDEMDDAFDSYASLVPEEATMRRALLAQIVKRKSDYFLDTVKDKPQSSAFADEAVDLAVGLLQEDPENLHFKALFVNAHVQRAQVLSQLDDLDGAVADLLLARQAVFDTKLSRPTTSEWSTLDRVVSFNQFLVHERVGSANDGKYGAARLKAELDFAAQDLQANAQTLQDVPDYAIWALTNSDAISALPAEDQVSYLNSLLTLVSNARPDQEDEFARRRIRSWTMNLLLSMPVDLAGEDTWKAWFKQASENGIVEDPAAQKRIFALAVFRNMPVTMAQHVTPEHAYQAKAALDSLASLDKKSDFAQAATLVRELADEISVVATSNEQRLAYARLENSIAAALSAFEREDQASSAWLELVDAGIATNQALAPGDSDSRILLGYHLGERAEWFRDSGNSDRAIRDYTAGLKVCIDDVAENPSAGTNFRNALVYTRELLKLETPNSLLPEHTLSEVDRLFGDILPDEKNRNLFKDSVSHIEGLQKQLGYHEISGSSLSAAKVDNYQRQLFAVLDSGDADLPTIAGTADASDADINSGLSETADPEVNTGDVTWSYDPLYSASWRTISGKERSELLNRLGFAEETSRLIRQTQLPFYDEGVLVEIERDTSTGTIGVNTYLVFPDALYELRGTSPPIHEANQRAPVRLDSVDQAAAYLRFFGTYVNGEGGAFQIVDSGGAINWSPEAASEEIARVGKKVRPLEVWADPEKEGYWKSLATLQYSNAIFSADMLVQPTGMVEMLDDRPIAGDLPITPIRISDRMSGTSAKSAARIRVEPEAVGLIAAPTFNDELKAVRSALVGPDAEDLDHLLTEYAFLLKDEVFLSTVTNPEIHSYMNTFAYELLTAETRIDDALRLAELAHQRKPDSPFIKDTYGWALVMNGQLNDGIALLREADEMFTADPPSPSTLVEVYAHLGHAYRLTEQHQLARKSLEKALAIEAPGHWLEFAKEELELLDN